MIPDLQQNSLYILESTDLSKNIISAQSFWNTPKADTFIVITPNTMTSFKSLLDINLSLTPSINYSKTKSQLVQNDLKLFFKSTNIASINLTESRAFKNKKTTLKKGKEVAFNQYLIIFYQALFSGKRKQLSDSLIDLDQPWLTDNLRQSLRQTVRRYKEKQ